MIIQEKSNAVRNNNRPLKSLSDMLKGKAVVSVKTYLENVLITQVVR